MISPNGAEDYTKRTTFVAKSLIIAGDYPCLFYSKIKGTNIF